MTPQRSGDGPWPWSLPGEGGALDWLRGLGLAAGDRVALAGLNQAGTAQALGAAMRLGLTVVLLNRRLAATELRRQLAAAAVRRVLADPQHPAAALADAAPLPAGFGAGLASGPCLGSLVLFTSGTTGAAKAARLGAGAVRAAVDAHVAALGLGPADRWWLPLPLDHVGGAMGVLRGLASGCTVALPERFSDDADLSGCTGTSVVPTMLSRLCEQGRPWPAGLRRLLTGGGPLSPALAARSAALGLAPSETYGLTEMGSMTTLDGLPVPGARLRLDDGRILVGGAMRFDGYEVDGRLARPAPEWHATGDLGEFTPDGRLRVIGRLAELIVSGGENVSAPEVEAALETHPAVAEAGVVGLSDPAWGEVVAAAVVVRGAVGADELAAHLAPLLAGFKRPRRWLFTHALPRTHTGKLRRAELRRLFPDQPSGSSTTAVPP